MEAEGKSKRRNSAFWLGLIGVFLLAFLVRLSCPASKYTVWYERSADFWGALLDGVWTETNQSYHPGVTTMWIAGSGIQLYLAAHGRPASDIVGLPNELPSPQSPPVWAGVAALSLVMALCVVLTYILLSRLTGWSAAFIAGCFLALDPFHITHSKMIHLDALLSSFMLLSALFLIVHLKEKAWGCLVFSAVFGGLACLTKSPALFLIPYTGLITTIHYAAENWGADPARRQAWRGQVWRIVRTLAIWGGIAALIFYVLWPAVWRQPWQTVSNMLVRGAVHHAEQSHPFPQFFLGQTVRDPGLLYYPAILVGKTTLITLPAIGLAIWFLVRGVPGKDSKTPWYLLIYVVFFVVQMTLSAKKVSRYLLPAFLALDVMAAWGVVQLTKILGRWKGWVTQDTARTLVTGCLLLIQVTAVLRVHPYYGAHHNLLMGGSPVARRMFQLGDQGEGLDLAARFLNEQPGAGFLTVGVCDPGNLMFRENFSGVTKPINHTDVDYRVFFVNDLQRSVRFEHCEDYWEACEQQGPIWSTSLDGVPYAWICRAYPQDLHAFTVDRRLDVQVGDHIDFLGYALSATQLSSNDPLTVTLFWRSDGTVSSDNHVFVHLLDADGSLMAQHDGVPSRGKRPTWGWQKEEVIPDEHVISPVQDTPAGIYTLSAGMYDYGTRDRLPAIAPDGAQFPADRIPLQDIELSHSSSHGTTLCRAAIQR